MAALSGVVRWRGTDDKNRLTAKRKLPVRVVCVLGYLLGPSAGISLVKAAEQVPKSICVMRQAQVAGLFEKHHQRGVFSKLFGAGQKSLQSCSQVQRGLSAADVMLDEVVSKLVEGETRDAKIARKSGCTLCQCAREMTERIVLPCFGCERGDAVSIMKFHGFTPS